MNVWKNRLSALLALQLVLAVGLWFAALHRDSVRQKAAGITHFEISAVDRIEITRGKETVTLVKEGDEWKLPDYYQVAADKQKVGNLLAELHDLKAPGPETVTSSSHERLHLESKEPEGRVKLSSGGKLVCDLLLGTSPSFGSRYVRVEGQDEVYRTNWAGADVTGQAKSWLDSDMLAISSLKSLKFPGFEMVKESGTWKIGDQKLDQEKAVELADRIAGMKVLSVADTPVPPDATSITAGADKNESLVYQIFSKDGKSFVRRSDRELVFEISKQTADALLQAKPENLAGENKAPEKAEKGQ